MKRLSTLLLVTIHCLTLALSASGVDNEKGIVNNPQAIVFG